MDRVSIDSVTSEDISEVTAPKGPGLSKAGNLKGIDALKDLQVLSEILGFEDGFETMGKEAEDLYAWSKEHSGTVGPEALFAVKDLVGVLGLTERGRPLLRKLHRWTGIDSNIKKLKEQQAVLEND